MLGIKKICGATGFQQFTLKQTKYTYSFHEKTPKQTSEKHDRYLFNYENPKPSTLTHFPKNQISVLLMLSLSKRLSSKLSTILIQSIETRFIASDLLGNPQ